MKIKKIAVLVGMGVAFSGVAQAVTPTNYYFGDVTNTSVSPSDAYLDAGLTTQYVGAGVFGPGYFYVTDQFEHLMNFSVDQPVIGSGMAYELQFFDILNIENLAVSLWSNDSGGPAKMLDFDVQNGVFGSAANGSGPLNPGSYYFNISGTGVGTSGGAYSITASTLPVPEAETWAMMLAGLGLVGLQLRRKGKVAKEIAVN